MRRGRALTTLHFISPPPGDSLQSHQAGAEAEAPSSMCPQAALLPKNSQADSTPASGDHKLSLSLGV